jgi:hypothetical protein
MRRRSTGRLGWLGQTRVRLSGEAALLNEYVMTRLGQRLRLRIAIVKSGTLVVTITATAFENGVHKELPLLDKVLASFRFAATDAPPAAAQAAADRLTHLGYPAEAHGGRVTLDAETAERLLKQLEPGRTTP